MSCNNCNCLDCARNRAIAKAKNHMNDMGDLEAPIQRPRWQDAEPANEVQARAWGDCLDLLVQQYSPLNMATACQLMADYFHVRPENYERLTLQFQKFIHENPKYETRKVRTGGFFKKAPTLFDEMSKAPKAVQDAAINMMVGTVDDYTCKGCGNNKCSTDEKSCWKCGRAIGT